jgi:hypothetical protein
MYADKLLRTVGLRSLAPGHRHYRRCILATFAQIKGAAVRPELIGSPPHIGESPLVMEARLQ